MRPQCKGYRSYGSHMQRSSRSFRHQFANQCKNIFIPSQVFGNDVMCIRSTTGYIPRLPMNAYFRTAEKSNSIMCRHVLARGALCNAQRHCQVLREACRTAEWPTSAVPSQVRACVSQCTAKWHRLSGIPSGLAESLMMTSPITANATL